MQSAEVAEFPDTEQFRIIEQLLRSNWRGSICSNVHEPEIRVTVTDEMITAGLMQSRRRYKEAENTISIDRREKVFRIFFAQEMNKIIEKEKNIQKRSLAV